MKYRWNIHNKKYDDVILQILHNRGIITEGDTKKVRESFLKPDFNHALKNAVDLSGVSDAIERIKFAVSEKEKVGIYGDYDADGIPGSAFLHKALKKIGLEVEVYIPTRSEGYGLSVNGLDYLKDRGCSLIITVDLGVKNIKEARHAKRVGLDLIITDHHLLGKELPRAVAVINPKIKSGYKFSDFSGAGVAYKLVQALSEVYPEKLNESFLKWNLDLIAVSTISDVVPLLGENRVLAKYGIMVLQKTKNVGLKELYKVANIDRKNISAYDVGFKIGPRINAPGRLDHATKSFELLITSDRSIAKKLAIDIDQTNQNRQDQMERLESEAKAKIKKDKLDQENIIIVSGSWPKGILGPSASNLVKEFSKPVIILSRDRDRYTGSARSVRGVDIMHFLDASSKYIAKYGGHKGAAGLTIESKNISQFKENIIRQANQEIDPNIFIPQIDIDFLLSLDKAKVSFIDDLSQLEPHGMGNPRPVFASEKVSLEKCRWVGKGKNHFSCFVSDGSNSIKSIFFDCIDKKDILKRGKYVDVAYTLDADCYNGRRYPQLKIIDIRKHGEE